MENEALRLLEARLPEEVGKQGLSPRSAAILALALSRAISESSGPIAGTCDVATGEVEYRIRKDENGVLSLDLRYRPRSVFVALEVYDMLALGSSGLGLFQALAEAVRGILTRGRFLGVFFIALMFGLAFWNISLVWLKKLHLEPEDLPPTGGRMEPQWIGGTVFGLVYFLPLIILIAIADVQVFRVPREKALLASFVQWLLIGAGSTLFYGPSIRQWVKRRALTHRKSEALLALIWASILLLPGFLGYSLLTPAGPPWASAVSAAIVGIVSASICMVSIDFFNQWVKASEEQPYERERGYVAGVLILVLLLLGDIAIRQSPRIFAAAGEWLAT